MVDIQRSIDYAAEAAASVRGHGADYAPRLHDLVVLLVRKYQHTRLLEDLDRAILRPRNGQHLTHLQSRADVWIGGSVEDEVHKVSA